MNLQELAPLFAPAYRIGHDLLLVPPADFKKLLGLTISRSRLFLLIAQGYADALFNGQPCRLEAGSLVDALETANLRINEPSDDLRAWCCLTTYPFASESLKNFRVYPIDEPFAFCGLPIHRLLPADALRIERALALLASSVANVGHHFRTEMAQSAFKMFNMELGDAVLSSKKMKAEGNRALSDHEVSAMAFVRLVAECFAQEHGIQFYADKMHLSTKHLTRIVKEGIGKTPHRIIAEHLTTQAMVILEDATMPVSTISEELHFPDQAAFCKFFKRQMGLTPMEYRTKHKKQAK